MNRLIYILIFVLIPLLVGCGVKKKVHQKVTTDLNEKSEKYEKAQRDLDEIKAILFVRDKKLSTAQKKIIDLESALSSKTEELTDSKLKADNLENELSELKTKWSDLNELVNSRDSQIEEMKAKINYLENQETYSFASAGDLFKAGEYSAAYIAYQSFIINFPNSVLIEEANNQIQRVQLRLDEQAEERKIQAKERLERERAERLRIGGALRSYEWSSILRGKNMMEIHSLLGPPDNTYSSNFLWEYQDRIIHSITNKEVNLYIKFGLDTLAKSFKASYNGVETGL